MEQQQIRLGTITKIYNKFGIVRAQVVVLDEDSPEDVILLNPYGQNSCPPVGSFVAIYVMFGNAENKYAIPFNQVDAPILKIGESVVYNHFGNQVYLKANGDIDIIADGKNVNITATSTTTSGTINSVGNINTAGVYKVDDTQVVTNRQAAIPNPTGGVTIDAEARAAIISVLTAMRTHGLITP